MKAITKCRACQSSNLTEFLDLGSQYLSDFRTDNKKPPKYPLVAVFCESCKLVQLKHTTPQYQMYHDRYGFKSGISDTIKKDLDSVVTHAFQYKNDPDRWLDIASNDGTLLSFVPHDIFRIGVDPVAFLCVEAEQHANEILCEYFGDSKLEMVFDVITTVSCFYDMPDPSKFVRDVKEVLNEQGVWIIQQNYLLATMELSAVDNFCHEHLEYYTLLSLENLLDRFGLEVNEVQISEINGGSIRTVVSHIGTFPIDESVGKQREYEQKANLDHVSAYQGFAETVGDELDHLHRLVKKLSDEGNTIAILAASTRGATIWQSANIEKYVHYAVERNPAKVGKMFSAIGIPIVSEKSFRESPPDFAIIGPWFQAPEFIDRESEYYDKGGKFILPLPEVKVV